MFLFQHLFFCHYQNIIDIIFAFISPWKTGPPRTHQRVELEPTFQLILINILSFSRARESVIRAFLFAALGIMKPSMKMGVVALIGLFVVFYQYHLSTSVRFDQMADFNGGGSAEDGPVLSQEEVERYVRTSKLTEEMVKTTKASSVCR